ncbi:MAG: hypothetical protein WBM07_17150 [Chitinivibrionales bacterium]
MYKKQSQLFYKRVEVSKDTEDVFFRLASGLGFILREFQLIHPTKANIDGVWYTYPDVNVELQDGSGVVRFQLGPIPAPLYSCPRSDGVFLKNEASPVDQTAYGVSMSASFKPRAKKLNLYYEPNEQINIRLTNMIFDDGQWMPDYIDVVCIGIYIPE